MNLNKANNLSSYFFFPANAHVAANNMNAHQAAYMNAAGQLPYGYAYYQAVPQAPGLYPAFTAPNVFVSILHLYLLIHSFIQIHSFIHSLFSVNLKIKILNTCKHSL